MSISKLRSLVGLAPAADQKMKKCGASPDHTNGTPEGKTPLQDYLEFYLTLDDPGYAVLVTGAWGTGKTFQVKTSVPEDSRYYVSLFGVQSTEQLHAEVFAAAFPKMEKVRAKVNKISEIGNGLGGVASIVSAMPAVLSSIIRRELETNRTIIFDDLERSSLNLEDVLGAINIYVEQMRFRVIVIAHDEKITKSFTDIKEKIFGHFIRIKPETSDAFTLFIDHSPNEPYKDFARNHSDEILEIFSQSGEQSLRILRHLIEDLERLYQALTPRHLEHPSAMKHLVRLFTAFNIETRAGRLSQADLRDRRRAQIAAAMKAAVKPEEDVATPPLINADSKYINLDLADVLLRDDLLVSMLADGRYAESEIRQSIDNSAYFFQPGDTPPWKVVISFDKLDDELVEAARERMDAQFNAREVTGSGEMLQIFSLRLMLVENGVVKRSLKEETASCKAYIDDLLEGGRLPPRETDWRWYDAFDRSYDGHGYWITEASSPHFKEIWDYLIAAREQALRNTLPKIAIDMLRQLATAPKAVFEMISPTNNGDNPYALIPILHLIRAEDFVAAWLAAPKEHWRTIKYALENRYDHGRLDRELLQERDWARQIHQALLERADAAEGLSALRIRRVIPGGLAQLAEEDKKSAATKADLT